MHAFWGTVWVGPKALTRREIVGLWGGLVDNAYVKSFSRQCKFSKVAVPTYNSPAMSSGFCCYF